MDRFISDSIRQGKTALQYTQDYLETVPHRLPFLSITSSPALQSVNEGLTADTSVHQMQDNIKINVSENERAFNAALLTYSQVQQSYTASLLQNSQDPSEISARLQLLHQLKEINKELVGYAQAISADMSKIHVTHKKLRHDLQRHQTHLHQYIHTLVKQRQHMVQNRSEITTAAGQEETTALVFHSFRAQYIVWLLLAMAVVSLTMHYIITDSPSSLGVVVVLLLLFGVVQWLSG